MENAIQVNEQEILIKDYQGQRVVTLWNIANLHGTTMKHIRNSFDRNRKHLIEGEDYFTIEKEDDFIRTICTDNVNKSAINRSKDIPIFTESGYLMITKSLTDDLSWQVQRQLVNCYFKVKESQPIEEKEEVPLSTGVNFFEELNNTVAKFDEVWSRIKK